MKVSTSRNREKRPLSSREWRRVLQQTVNATTNERYRRAVDVLEHTRKKYELGENGLGTLALCYDHLACKKHQKKMREKYLAKAADIYQNLLANNPRHVGALIGMNRVCDIRGDHAAALRYSLRAHRAQQKSKKTSFRYIIGVSSHYERIGDLARAERWLKKELCVLGKENLAANANLMIFYARHGEYAKALPFAQATERLMKREFSKALYRSSGIQKSKHFGGLRNIIKELRKRTEKAQ